MVRRSISTLDSPAAKVIAVLDAVAGRGTASVASVASQLSIPPPTIHRIAKELERLGYLQREPGSRHLSVSEPLIKLASSVLTAASGRAAVHVSLRKLSESIGEMCSLAVQVGDQVMYVASVEPQQDLMLSFDAGRKSPLFCTSSGRLFLARLSDDELRGYLKASRRKAYTTFTQTKADRIIADIRKVRDQGFAIANQEYILHIVGAAVPVVSADGTMIAALSVAALKARMDLERLRALIPEMQRSAADLARTFSQTGARPPAAAFGKAAHKVRAKSKAAAPPGRSAQR